MAESDYVKASETQLSLNDWVNPSWRSNKVTIDLSTIDTSNEFNTITENALRNNEVANDKSDGIYALAIVPVVKDKLMAKARYDLYRPTASSVAAKTNYEVGLNYRFCKYLEVQTEYCFTHDRALAEPDYSSVFVQVSIRY